MSACSNCGGEMECLECETCGGEGQTHPGELYEQDPLWYDEDDVEPCHMCGGAGRWWVCANSKEWCEAHSLKPRSTP